MTIFIRISPGVVLVVALALIFGRSSGIGGVLASVLIGLLILAVLAVAGVAVAVVRRLRLTRNPSPEGFVRTAPVHELAETQRPAIPQHVHFHFGAGADPRAVDEILRRSQRPEQ